MEKLALVVTTYASYDAVAKAMLPFMICEQVGKEGAPVKNKTGTVHAWSLTSSNPLPDGQHEVIYHRAKNIDTLMVKNRTFAICDAIVFDGVWKQRRTGYGGIHSIPGIPSGSSISMHTDDWNRSIADFIDGLAGDPATADTVLTTVNYFD